jgi:tryptophan synthase alpha subunit
VGRLADAVVIGSALIRTMEEASQQGRDTLEAAKGFLQPIRQALDAIA